MFRENNASEVVWNDLEYIIENAHDSFAQMQGKRILITGGAGFLGYYLVSSIAHWNKTKKGKIIGLTVLDNYFRGKPDWVDVLADEGIVFIEQSVVDPLPESLPAFDFIIHAASIASPIYYRKSPIETMDADVVGLRQLLDRIRIQKNTERPCEGLLFFSSSEIYGDPADECIPTPETYNGDVSCIGPRACYDESKRYGETLAVNFAKQYDLPCKIVRPFNDYGPGLKITDARVLPDFAKCIFEGRDIELLSDGTPTRTFSYVADSVVGYFRILTHGRAGEAYNGGTPIPELTMSQFAEATMEIAKDLYGYSGKIIFKTSEDPEYLTDNPLRRCPDITKIKEELGYNPSIPFAEGLKRSLMWYSENHSKGKK